jgi:hypothetical protein
LDASSLTVPAVMTALAGVWPTSKADSATLVEVPELDVA